MADAAQDAAVLCTNSMNELARAAAGMVLAWKLRSCFLAF